MREEDSSSRYRVRALSRTSPGGFWRIWGSKTMIPIRSEGELSKIRESAALLVTIFRGVEPHIKAGVATREIDALADGLIRSGGGNPAFKGYMGYPASGGISIDEEVGRGI